LTKSKYKYSEILYLKTDSEYIICKLQYCIIYTQHALNVIHEERNNVENEDISCSEIKYGWI